MYRILVVGALASGFACEKQTELPEATQGPGVITIVDTGGDDGKTGWWPSIAFAPDDTPHISYCDAQRGNLMYATRRDGEWRSEVVEHWGAVGKYTALAVDSKGKPGIGFYDQGHKYLRYAWREDGTWKTERIAWGLEIGQGSEMTFDARDVPHLFYYVSSGRLVHSWRKGPGEWDAETIAEAVGGFSARISVRPRSDGYWVSFVDWGFKDTSLMLATPKPEGGYSLERVAEKQGPGWRSVLAFPNERPYLIYSQSFKERIKIAEKIDDDWRVTVLLRRAANFAGTQTANGDLVVAYEDIFWGNAGNGTVKYLRLHNNEWSRVTVDNEGPVGEYIDVAANSRGKIIIAYYSDVVRGLKVYDETAGATTKRGVRQDPATLPTAPERKVPAKSVTPP